MSHSVLLRRPKGMREDSNRRSDQDVEVAWREHRGRALNVAYRMLGSVSDAEDAVQEAYARLARADQAEIDDVRGWLVTVTSRLCLDQLRSAHARRVDYPGPWLPEPLVEGSPARHDPGDQVTLDESVRMALMLVLEQLSPAERTAFVLHDVFQLPFDEISAIVGRSPDACRQLASRARRHVTTSSAAPRFEVDVARQRRVVTEFAAACATGRIEPLVAVLAQDAVGEFDSGGVIEGAPRKTVHGAEQMARILVRNFAGTDARFDVADVNGDPGLVITLGDQIVAVASIAIRGDRITSIHTVGNPAKLTHLNA